MDDYYIEIGFDTYKDEILENNRLPVSDHEIRFLKKRIATKYNIVLRDDRLSFDINTDNRAIHVYKVKHEYFYTWLWHNRHYTFCKCDNRFGLCEWINSL